MEAISATNKEYKTTDINHLPWLDGLRGMAALWVLLSHIQILSGMRSIAILSWGGLAVDLFMMLSGFLMTHHYLLRRDKEPWEVPSTWAVFWLRRFFRIAPLYYFLLIITFAIGAHLGDARQDIAQLWPTTATALERYYDHSITNFLMHISFIFGVIPEYAFRTPLPDWSIGLEMQFYLAFPFLMLMFSRLGAIKAGIVVVILSMTSVVIFSHFFKQFEMPAFLPLKLHMFVIGMWLAVSRQQKYVKTSLLAAVAIAIVFFILERTTESIGRILMVVGMYYLMNKENLPQLPGSTILIDKTRQWFSNKFASFLGDTSYSVYLLHLIILLPVAGTLTHYHWYTQLTGWGRFTTCFLMTAPMVYLMSWFLYQLVEKNGIRFGKQMITLFKMQEDKEVSNDLAVNSKAKH